MRALSPASRYQPATICGSSLRTTTRTATRRAHNHALFADSLRRSGIPFLTVECAFGDEPFCAAERSPMCSPVAVRRCCGKRAAAKRRHCPASTDVCVSRGSMPTSCFERATGRFRPRDCSIAMPSFRSFPASSDCLAEPFLPSGMKRRFPALRRSMPATQPFPPSRSLSSAWTHRLWLGCSSRLAPARLVYLTPRYREAAIT